MHPMLSVIVPAFNEEEVLSPALERLEGVLDSLGEEYEIIFVNDGSRDNTGKMLSDMVKSHPRVKALHFSRNFGHQLAVTAGLDAAAGDAMVIIDCDLQDPPEVIPEMVEKWREGYDVVYGKRLQREGETFFKKATAWGFYRVLNALSGVDIPVDTGDFRLVSRKAADAVRSMSEHNRFLRGMFAWVGFSQTEVAYHRDPRLAGETKYTLKKMLRLARDGILGFSLKPLEWVFWLGILLCVLGGLWLFIAALCALLGESFAALAGLCVFLTGLTVTSLGVACAYIGRIYDEVKGRPLYLVAHRQGFEEKSEKEKQTDGGVN